MSTKNDVTEISLPINLSSFQTKTYTFTKPEKEVKDFGYNLEIRVDEKSDSFEVSIKIEVKESKNSDDIFCKIETTTSFDIGKKPKNLEEKKLPDVVRFKLIDISYSTTRGALITKSENNFLVDYPLPILNVGEIKNTEERKKATKE